ncbi:MAG: VanZ family protein [Lachnospiraceae bacterium]|nr:VanZ family protein [Lachnospiraceae bacterium]
MLTTPAEAQESLKKYQRKRIGFVSMLLLIIYACIILYFVLFSDRLGRVEGYQDYRYNLKIGQEIGRFIKYRNEIAPGAFLLNVIGNFGVFAPIGFLVPMWRTRHKTRWYQILLISFFFSLAIETAQLYTKVGVFDVDDLLMNTTGGMLGYLAYRLIGSFYDFNRRGHLPKNEKQKN